MNIGLVDCSINPRITNGRQFLPLGLLSIAAVAKDQGHKVELIRLDKFMPSYPHSQDWNSLPAIFSSVIAEKDFDVLGFTTRCDILPLVIEVARQHKSRLKDVPIVLGGPGSTFIDQKIVRAFPFIEVIVRGEGEQTFAELLPALERHYSLSKIGGITFRGTFGRIIRTHDRPPIRNLDFFPDPAFELVEDILNSSDVWWIGILVGYGCPNRCHFCSTCAFAGIMRMRSPEKVVAEMKMFNEKYRISCFNLIHDNIFNCRRFLHDFCKLIREYLPNVKWGGSASLNFSSPEIIKTIARNRCTDIFVGIETASDKIAKNIPKKFLPPQNVHKTLDLFRKYNVRVTKSYILGFPDETNDDIDRTLMLAIEAQASATLQLCEYTQIHPLTISPGTELYGKYRDRLAHIKPMGDFANKCLAEIESCLDMCKHYPSIFTSYASHMKNCEYTKIIELCNFYVILTLAFPRTTFISLRELELTPIEFLRHFRNYVFGHRIDLSSIRNHIPPSDSVVRCILQVFPDALKYIYHDLCQPQHFTKLFLNYEQPRVNIHVKKHTYINLCSKKSLNNNSTLKRIPIIPETTVLLSLEYDPDKLFHEFQLNGKRTMPTSDKKTHILYYLPRNKVDEQTPFMLAGQKLSGLIGRITRIAIPLVDGKRSCLQIVDEVAKTLRLSEKLFVTNEEIQNILRSLIYWGVLMLLDESITNTLKKN